MLLNLSPADFIDHLRCGTCAVALVLWRYEVYRRILRRAARGGRWGAGNDPYELAKSLCHRIKKVKTWNFSGRQNTALPGTIRLRLAEFPDVAAVAPVTRNHFAETAHHQSIVDIGTGVDASVVGDPFIGVSHPEIVLAPMPIRSRP